MTRETLQNRAGFTLIEVNMALLVVGLGLVALLGLFPVGLRESGLASADTTEAIFATRVLNAIQGNAGEITKWTDWESNDSFTQGIKIDSTPLKGDGKVQKIINANGVAGNVIRYVLNLGAVTDTGNRIRYAAIRVADDEYSAVTNNVVYYTEFRYGSH